MSNAQPATTDDVGYSAYKAANPIRYVRTSPELPATGTGGNTYCNNMSGGSGGSNHAASTLPVPRDSGDMGAVNGSQPAYNFTAPGLLMAGFAPLTGDVNLATKAKTYDDGKLPLAWLPWDAIRAMNAVQQYGHAKYLDFNNFRKGMEVSRNLSCALRHISEYMEGADNDHESGLNHLAHAMCRLAFVLQNLKDGTAIDDRYKVTT